MYTIYQNSNKKFLGFKSFKDQMIEICNNHQKNNRALAFAFILYDFENPQLSKILNDQDYWLDLNKLSGNYLTVFSLHYKQKKKVLREKITPMLFSLPIEFNPSKGTNLLIKKYFGEVHVNYPAILFFQVENNSVIDTLLIELEENKIEDAFGELKLYIKSAVGALKSIKDEYLQNHKDIFDCLESAVQSTQANIKLKRNIKKFGKVIGLISSIKGLFSFTLYL